MIVVLLSIVLFSFSVITCASTDPFPHKGDLHLSQGTTVIPENAVTGIEEGDLYIPSGATLHLESNATFIWNPGYSIHNEGQITWDTGGRLRKGYLCVSVDGIHGCWQDPIFCADLPCPLGYVRWKDVWDLPSCDDEPALLDVPFQHQGPTDWCWATCASMILNYFGIEKEPWEIAAADEFNAGPNDGLNFIWAPYEFHDYLEKYYDNGHEDAWARDLKESNTAIKDTIIEALEWGPVWTALFSIGHVIVVVGASGDQPSDYIYFHDPQSISELTGGAIFQKMRWDEFFEAISSPFKIDAFLIYARQGMFDVSGNIPITVSPLWEGSYLTFSEQGSKLRLEWDGSEPYPEGYHYQIYQEGGFHFPADASGRFGYAVTVGSTLEANGVLVSNATDARIQLTVEAKMLPENRTIRTKDIHVDGFASTTALQIAAPLSDYIDTPGVHTILFSVSDEMSGVVYDTSRLSFNVAPRGDGTAEKYAFLLCGDPGAEFENSVEDLKSALTTWWQVDHVKVYESWKGTEANLETAIREWCGQPDGDDLLIFYYTGHGLYGLIGPEFVTGEGSVQYHPDLDNWLNTGAGATIILLDTCYSGSATAGDQFNLKGPNRWILTACDNDEESYGWDLLGLGWIAYQKFTRYFVDAISWQTYELPDIAGADRLISLREAFDYVDRTCNDHLVRRQDPQIWPREGDYVVQSQREKPEGAGIIFFGAYCPVDITIIDPSGKELSKDINEIGENAFRVEGDFDGDGENDVFYKIHAPSLGEYSVQVVPEPSASPTDTFTLLTGSQGTVTTIAEDTEVADIPDEPYTVDPAINTPAGIAVQLEFPDQYVRVRFDQVTEHSNTTVTTTTAPSSGSYPGITFLGTLYEITTTASYTGAITVEVFYDDSSLTKYEEEALALFKIAEDGTATNITTSVDPEQNVVTGVTDGFSSFAVGVVLSGIHTPAVFRVTREGDVRADGTFYGKSFETGSADVAEWVVVSESVEPGDVLELDPYNPGHYRKVRGPCSTLVAGVVSSDPGVILGSEPQTPDSGLPPPDRALLALLGIVPVKVTDEGGPIQPGDLLTTSSTPGHAMRWNPNNGSPCDLVGKALEPLTDERGVILVLLMSH